MSESPVNYRKGFTRLAVATGVPYFGLLALSGYLSCSAHTRYLKLGSEAILKGDQRSWRVWTDYAAEAQDQCTASMVWGVAVPIIAVIVAALGYWVYRGFKPRAANSPSTGATPAKS